MESAYLPPANNYLIDKIANSLLHILPSSGVDLRRRAIVGKFSEVGRLNTGALSILWSNLDIGDLVTHSQTN